MTRTPKALPQSVITRRQAAIKSLLRAGRSVTETAYMVKPRISPRRVRDIANKHNLPLNPKLSPSSKEAQEIKRLAPLGFTITQLSLVFRQTPRRIKTLLKQGFLE